MEILRAGKNKKIRFVCHECDCVFDANLGEALVVSQGQGAFNFVEYACRCPHCGYSCSKTVNTCCPEQLSMAIGKYGVEVAL